MLRQARSNTGGYEAFRLRIGAVRPDGFHERGRSAHEHRVGFGHRGGEMFCVEVADQLALRRRGCSRAAPGPPSSSRARRRSRPRPRCARSGRRRPRPRNRSAVSVRNIDITGVMPLPPETNRMRRGRIAGSTKSPPTESRPTTMPGRAWSHRYVDTTPPSWRPIVSSMWRALSRTCRRVAPGAAAPVDLDGEVDVLAGPETSERAIRFQGQRDAAGRLPPHRDDLRAGLAAASRSGRLARCIGPRRGGRSAAPEEATVARGVSKFE